jgi:hypothetical protein
LHGSVFGFGQNNGLNAYDLFQRRLRAASSSYERADYTRGQFGFNLRGPITEDRTFFSVSYEGQSIDNRHALVDLCEGLRRADQEPHGRRASDAQPESGAHAGPDVRGPVLRQRNQFRRPH